MNLTNKHYQTLLCFCTIFKTACKDHLSTSLGRKGLNECCIRIMMLMMLHLSTPRCDSPSTCSQAWSYKHLWVFPISLLQPAAFSVDKRWPAWKNSKFRQLWFPKASVRHLWRWSSLLSSWPPWTNFSLAIRSWFSCSRFWGALKTRMTWWYVIVTCHIVWCH